MAIIDPIYKNLARPLFFRFDPETMHEWVMGCLSWARPVKPLLRSYFRVDDPRLTQEIWGLRFANPIGLAGGFDKNALLPDFWDAFGFAFFETGTVTPLPQPGNPKPRLFRYPAEQALVNRMGFNNDGCEAIARRLSESTALRGAPRAVMGVSLGKQKDTPADDIARVIRDYQTSLEALYPHGGFFVVNVSSPNTPNLRDLQEAGPLRQLLAALKERMAALNPPAKPLCLKISPNLGDDAVRQAVDVALSCGIDGFIATNTTNQTGGRESGGLSGYPLRQRSTEVIRLIAKQTGGALPIIGCGGIFTAADAIEKLQAGAWLLQLYTSFIYAGPAVVRNILQGLLGEMDHRRISHIRDWRG
ncbi:MAG TPA: quinone-dependent dihydroorotate dehydrogenase [bacterium]|nr:quinone-dependent dihydroorotate dehydrogenase [bacterium]